jgi:hypothetical protein
MHGFLGIAVASLWKVGSTSTTRADHAGAVGAEPAPIAPAERTEDRIPRVVVSLHGGAALATLVVAAALALVD